jgi:hypothetical protein
VQARSPRHRPGRSGSAGRLFRVRPAKEPSAVGPAPLIDASPGCPVCRCAAPDARGPFRGSRLKLCKRFFSAAQPLVERSEGGNIGLGIVAVGRFKDDDWNLAVPREALKEVVVGIERDEPRPQAIVLLVRRDSSVDVPLQGADFNGGVRVRLEVVKPPGVGGLAGL